MAVIPLLKQGTAASFLPQDRSTLYTFHVWPFFITIKTGFENSLLVVMLRKLLLLNGLYPRRKALHHKAPCKHSLVRVFHICKLFSFPITSLPLSLENSVSFQLCISPCKPLLLAFLVGDAADTKNSLVPVILLVTFGQSLSNHWSLSY